MYVPGELLAWTSVPGHLAAESQVQLDETSSVHHKELLKEKIPSNQRKNATLII